MRKFVILVIMLAVSTGLLFSQKLHEDENPFMKYYQDQTSENLIEAIKSFNVADEDNTGFDNSIMLSNLYFIALENELAILDENIDSLATRDKFRYANLLLSLNRFESSIAIYNQLNEDTPDWSCPWRHKGEALFKSDNLVDAEIALQKAIETRIEHYDAYVMLADVQNDMGKSEEALATLETGFSYLGKDIEEADEEVNDLDVQFLYLDLLKKNDKQDEYLKLKAKLEERAPEDSRLVD